MKSIVSYVTADSEKVTVRVNGYSNAFCRMLQSDIDHILFLAYHRKHCT